MTLEESARIAGVSPETIEQYAAFGLLKKSDSGDGTPPRFSETDIRSLFYTKQQLQAAAESEERLPEREDEQINRAVNDKPQAAETGSPAVEAGTREETEPVKDAGPVKDPGVKKPAATLTLRSEVPTLDRILDDAADDSAAVEEKAASAEADARSKAAAVDSSAENASDSSVSSGQQVPALAQSELLEINKSLRQQVEMLQEERDWLRQRVERLEQRSEREQMLLLSENETVRRLISSREQHADRRSIWRFALPWFGFSDDKQQK